MPIFDRQRRHHLDQLVEEYVTTSNVNRREFLQRATAIGLSASAATSLLAACVGSSNNGSVAKVTSIDLLSELSGEELDTLKAINTAFTKKTGIKVNTESTRDLPAVLTT